MLYSCSVLEEYMFDVHGWSPRARDNHDDGDYFGFVTRV